MLVPGGTWTDSREDVEEGMLVSTPDRVRKRGHSRRRGGDGTCEEECELLAAAGGLGSAHGLVLIGACASCGERMRGTRCLSSRMVMTDTLSGWCTVVNSKKSLSRYSNTCDKNEEQALKRDDFERCFQYNVPLFIFGLTESYYCLVPHIILCALRPL
eukprot:2267356-Rhodomonas_salina.1